VLAPSLVENSGFLGYFALWILQVLENPGGLMFQVLASNLVKIFRDLGPLARVGQAPHYYPSTAPLLL